MTRDDIIKMAIEARLPSCHASHVKALGRFADLVEEYLAGKQRQPLSDGWILGLWPDTGFPKKVIEFARKIEAWHGITG